MCSVLELTSADLDRKYRSVLAPMLSFEGDRFPARYLLSDPRNRCLVQGRIEVPRMHSDHLLAAVTQALTRLPIDVDKGLMLVEEEESIGCVIDETAKARFARAQLVLSPLALGDVARQAQISTSALLKLANAN